MEQKPAYMAFTCLNPECQKKIKLKIPAKTGVYSIKCPHCGSVKNIRIKGLDVFAQPEKETVADDNSQKSTIALNHDFFVGTSYNVTCPHCKGIKIPIRPEKAGMGIIKCPKCKGKTSLRVQNKPVSKTEFESNNSSKGEANKGNTAMPLIDLGDDFYINQSYTVTCPHCREEKLTILQEDPGQGIAVCPKCKGRVQFTARKPTETINKSELIQSFKGKLILLRRGWINKDYHLNEGSNIVGRYDESKVSDIAIKGDSSMSRQSVEIYVDHHDKGYSFKLTIKNSTNPVLHNNKPLSIGDSISLNFGDSIILGKTKFRFDKDV